MSKLFNRIQMMKDKNILILNVLAFILAGSNTYGYNPIGVGYFMAMCGNGYGSIGTILLMMSSMALRFTRLEVIKYTAVMFMGLLICKIIKMKQNERYGISIITLFSMIMIEIGDKLMNPQKLLWTNNTFVNELFISIMVAVLSLCLTYIFNKSIVAWVNRRWGSDEDLFSLAIIVGLSMYNIVMQYKLPTEMNCLLIFLTTIIVAYKYGSAQGAAIGAAMGIVLSLYANNAGLLGIMCMLGISLGMFREVGKLLCAMSMLIISVATGLTMESYLISDGCIKGIMAAVIVFMCMPKEMLCNDEDEAQTNMSEKIENMFEERLMNISKSFDKLSQSIRMMSGKEVLAEGDTDEMVRMNLVWKQRLDESRNTMSEQFGEISRIIEEYSKETYDFVAITSEQEEALRCKLKNHKIKMTKIAGIENRRHKQEFLITCKCNRGLTIGTREVAEILSSILGKEYMPARNCRKVLSSEYTTTAYVEKANFYVMHGAARKARGQSGISGDNYSFQELENGQMLMSLSDGMGYGTSACIESETVIELLEQLLDSGFSEDVALKMINSVMLMNSENEHPATLDFSVIDLHSGMCDLVKIGAATTFVKRGKWVEMVKSTSMPLGMFGDVDYDSTTKKLYDGDLVIMVSDGVIDAMDCENKDEKLSDIIMNIESQNPKEIADYILEKAACDETVQADDMTVLVTGIFERSQAISLRDIA